MLEQPDVHGALRDRVQRHVADALRRYRAELKAVSADVAAKGLYNSGGHLRRRVEVLRKWMLQLTDECFEDVTRLPGQQDMHRMVHADFLADQLGGFLREAEGEVLCFDPRPAASNAIKQEIQPIREGLEHDLRDFQAQLWRPRPQGQAASVTNNTVNLHGSNVGSIQQAAESAAQTAVANLQHSAASGNSLDREGGWKRGKWLLTSIGSLLFALLIAATQVPLTQAASNLGSYAKALHLPELANLLRAPSVDGWGLAIGIIGLLVTLAIVARHLLRNRS